MKKWKMCVFVLLAASALLLPGCAGAGEDEVLTNASGETSRKVTDTMEEIELSEEEAEQDHLFLQVTNDVTVDADITPRSHYSSGIGMWQPCADTDSEDGESSEWISYAEMEESQITLGDSGLTLSEVDSAFSEMTESFGTVWQEAYEDAKSRSVAGSSDTFWYRESLSDLKITTQEVRKPVAAYEGAASELLYCVQEDLDFLPAETVRQAVTAVYRKILPDMGVSCCFQSNTLEQQQRAVEFTNASVSGANAVLNQNAKEYYQLQFFETIEGIPIKRTMLSWQVGANQLAEGSTWQNSWWVSQGVSSYPSEESLSAIVTVTESGFDFWICCTCLGHEKVRDAQEVVDINEILNSACEKLVSYGETITVGSVELVMALTTVEDEDGVWLVYAPFWTVDYYRYTRVSSENFNLRYQMVFDGYTGELLNDVEYS